MRVAALILSTVVVLALTACAPNTDAAYKVCFDTMKPPSADLEKLPLKDAIDVMLVASEYCEKAAKDDPEAFIAKWLG